MNKEYIQQITRGFTEQPKSEEPKSSAIDIFFDREYEKQNPKSESVHFKGRPIIVQPDFEVKSMIERESYDMTWNAGVREGADQKRAEIIAMVMNMTRENPLVSGLEILKKL